jgi:hypothetical protein
MLRPAGIIGSLDGVHTAPAHSKTFTIILATLHWHQPIYRDVALSTMQNVPDTTGASTGNGALSLGFPRVF